VTVPDARKLQVIIDSAPAEIRENSVLLEVKGKTQEIPNDYVWVFAGGTPPNAFLEKIGVQLGARDMTKEAHDEAAIAKAAAESAVPLATKAI
jgi:thioredoxin reductase